MLEGREGDGDDGGIELTHEGTDAHGGDGEPVGVGALTDAAGATGLDQQTIPVPSRKGRRHDSIVRP